jgi:serine/threonine protein kinase
MFALRKGAQLGQYEIVRVVGSGGMGVVYEAHHEALGRRVALKVMHTPTTDAPNELATARFLREGRAAAQVRHDNVVDVFDFGVHEGTPFLVMELVEGESLSERLEREGTLPVSTALELLLPIFSAVSALHAAGIIHRDLKPANILLGRGRAGEISPKVADFGVSRIDDAPGLTESGVVVGSYPYMPPEQVRALKEATERADQYSLGAILYECLTGKRPYEGTSAYELAHAILHAPLVSASSRSSRDAKVPVQIPVALDAVLNRALAREPESRFPSVDDFGAALLPFAGRAAAARWTSEFAPPSGHSPLAQTIPPVSSSQVHRPRRPRRPWGATVGVAVVLSLAIWLAFLRGPAAPSRDEGLATARPQNGPSKTQEATFAEPSSMAPPSAFSSSTAEGVFAPAQPVSIPELPPAAGAAPRPAPTTDAPPRAIAVPTVKVKSVRAPVPGNSRAHRDDPAFVDGVPLLDPR